MGGSRDNNINGERRRKADPRLISKSKREELERKKLKRERARRKARVKRVILSFFLLIFIIVGISGVSVFKFISSLKSDKLSLGVAPRTGESLNILILGMDVGDVDQANNKSLRRTDTMMVMNYNPNTEKINVVSIPRDTLIEVDAYDDYGNLIPYWKINSAYALGGEEEVIRHVEDLIESKINYIVEINYEAFRNFIDAIGGVEMYIERDMIYDDDAQDLHINFRAGETVLLDGEKAEEFFRWRKNNDGTGFENGDLGRIENQQKFVNKVMDKCLSPTIIFKIPKILDVIRTNIDTNMPAEKMFSYGFKFLMNKDISFNTLQGYDETLYGQSFLVVDRESNAELLESLKSGNFTDNSSVNRDYSILILNGTRINGLAGNLQADMERIGYTNISVGNAEKTSNSIIICNNKEIREQLKLDVGIKKFEKNKSEEYADYDAVIIIGEDFSIAGE